MGNITTNIRQAMMKAAMQAFGSLFHLQVFAAFHLGHCTCMLPL
jgi:hypothetical protein